MYEELQHKSEEEKGAQPGEVGWRGLELLDSRQIITDALHDQVNQRLTASNQGLERGRGVVVPPLLSEPAVTRSDKDIRVATVQRETSLVCLHADGRRG